MTKTLILLIISFVDYIQKINTVPINTENVKVKIIDMITGIHNIC